MAAEQKDDPKVSPVAEDPIQPQLCLYYFIGRLNPPHEGHILALAEMLNAVKEQQKRGNRAKALILLGNGPRNKTKGFGSSDNPIHFDLKERIVRAQLTKMFNSPQIQKQIMDTVLYKLNDYKRQQGVIS